MFRPVLMSLLLTTILVGCKAETVNEMTDVVKTEETVEKIQSLTSVSVPDAATAAETLLYATGADITFKSMMILSVDEMMRAVSQSGQKVDKAELDRMVQIGNAEVEDMLPEIISDLGEIYEKHFTDAEMLEMAAFFNPAPAANSSISNQLLRVKLLALVKKSGRNSYNVSKQG